MLERRPKVLHQVVQERAALSRIQPWRGLLQFFGSQAPAREGAERAGRLVGEHARAAAHLLDLDGGCFRVVERVKILVRKQDIPVARIVGDRKRRGWNLENQRAGGEIAVFLLPGPGEDHFLRRAGPFLRDAPAELERALGARLRDAGLLLQRDRDERVGPRGERPGLVGQAAHPQAVEAQPRRLEDAEDLDRRVGGFGLEQGVGAKLFQNVYRFFHFYCFRNPFELCKFTQHLVPLGASLELLRVERALAREASRLEQRREMPRPFGRGLFSRVSRQCKYLFQCLPQKRAWLGEGDQLGKSDRRLELPAQAHVERRAPRHLGFGAGEEGGANQPTGPRKIDRGKGKIKESQSGVDKRVVRERLAQ